MGIKFSNLASTTLASGVSSSTTSISVTSATSFPTLGSGDYFYASIGIGSASEVVKVTSISGTTFTAVRGQDSTTAISHSSGAEIALRVVAATLEDLRDATDNDTTYSAGTGVSLSGTTFSLTDTNSKLNLSGGTLTGNLNLGDNDKAVFGASDDLQIYHDGSNSFITDTGTGNLYVRASNELALTSAAGEAFFLGIADGSSYLYHNGSVKLNTTATGIDVTGSVTATGGNSGNWNTAYGWGNHASAGYLTSHQSLSGYATETYVGTQVSNLVDSSPSTLNTLNELAAALGDDPNFATTVSTSIGTKLPLAGGTLTGGLSGTTGSFSGSVTASTSMLVGDGEAYGFGDNSYRIEGKDDGANARIGFVTGGAEKMRLSGGNLLVGKTSTSYAVEGIALRGDNAGVQSTVTDEACFTANRLNSDGRLILFAQDTATVGSIGTDTSGNLQTLSSS